MKVVDSMPPQITLNGQEVVIIDLGTRFKDPGAIAVDALDGQVSVFADSDFFPAGMVVIPSHTALWMQRGMFQQLIVTFIRIKLVVITWVWICLGLSYLH